ncbi:response regulator transcription factor, partial [Rhizobiaceae sp. 2RAB30]
VMAILFYLSHRIVDELRDHLTIPQSEQTVRLTRRETECLGWVAEGKNAQETALIMGLSVQTVRDHLKRVRAKLGSSTRAQALLRASAMGLLSSHH